MNDSFWTTVDAFGGPLSLRTSRRYTGADGLVAINATACETTYSLTRSYLLTLACTLVVPPPSAVRAFDKSQTVEAKFSAVLKAFSRLSDAVPVVYVLVPPPHLYGLTYARANWSVEKAAQEREQMAMQHEKVSRLLSEDSSVRLLLDATSFLDVNSYYRGDGHLTARGQAAVAEHLAPLLRAELDPRKPKRRRRVS